MHAISSNLNRRFRGDEMVCKHLHLAVPRIALAVLDAQACVVRDAGFVGNAADVALSTLKLSTHELKDVSHVCCSN